ncbi:hypothetical protein C2S52_009262 [Perilla frutescens var. hirtella]|nr:hypothetical protein C2S52_009262 [Perilla frutescens var. hirtella]
MQLFGAILPKELKQAQRLGFNFFEPATGCSPSSSKSPASSEALADMLGRWASFDEDFITIALDDVLRCKRMAKMDAS